MGKQWKQWLTLFFWAPKSLQMMTAAMKLKDAYSLEGKLWPTYAKSLQSFPTQCDPIDGSPPGSPIPGILQARTLEWAAISFSNLGSMLKSRDVTFPKKVHLVKAMVFPVAMYGCVSWTIKKAEPWRIDAFELWCWRRLVRVPWTARRSNQSILKEISPECSLDGLMLNLKF